MTKKRSNQKGRGDEEPATFDLWYNSPMADYAKYRVSIGDTSNLENRRNWYLAKAGKKYSKSDIDETKYDPESALARYIRENHLISSVVGGVVGIGANVLFPGSGAVAGPALKLVLQQMGLGAPRLKHHRKDPVSTKFTRIQHGKGANLIQSVQRNPIMCSPNSNSYGGVKF